MKNSFLIGERIYLRPLAEENLDCNLHTKKVPVLSISGTSNFSLVLNSQAGRYSRVERVLHVIYTANKICKIDEPFWSTATS